MSKRDTTKRETRFYVTFQTTLSHEIECSETLRFCYMLSHTRKTILYFFIKSQKSLLYWVWMRIIRRHVALMYFRNGSQMFLLEALLECATAGEISNSPGWDVVLKRFPLRQCKTAARKFKKSEFWWHWICSEQIVCCDNADLTYL